MGEIKYTRASVDIKELSQEHLNQIAARLAHNSHVIQTAGEDAVIRTWGPDIDNGELKSLKFELLDEPEVTIHYEGSSSEGNVSFSADWECLFNVVMPGGSGVGMMGKCSFSGEDLMRLDPELFYFEDVESYSEE